MGNSKTYLEALLIPLLKKYRKGELVKIGNYSLVETINAHAILSGDDTELLNVHDIIKTDEAYVNRELRWYLTMSRSIHPDMSSIKIWQQTADSAGIVNSNYGWCIYSKENGSQYEHAVNFLKNDRHSRQSTCIYTRPSIQEDYCTNGRYDMICTFATQHLIRDEELHYIVNMRSNDAIYGFKNDFAWHHYVANQMKNELGCTKVHIHWNAGSFHVYDRHFKLLDSLLEIPEVQKMVESC
jgi:thymidylate synthase